MWIKCENSATEEILFADMDERVTIPDSGVVQVRAEVGERLLDQPGFVEHTGDEANSAGSDAVGDSS